MNLDEVFGWYVHFSLCRSVLACPLSPSIIAVRSDMVLFATGTYRTNFILMFIASRADDYTRGSIDYTIILDFTIPLNKDLSLGNSVSFKTSKLRNFPRATKIGRSWLDTFDPTLRKCVVQTSVLKNYVELFEMKNCDPRP